MMILLLHRKHVLCAAMLLLLSITVLSLSLRRTAVPAFSYTEMATDEIIVLDEGRVVERGTHEEVMRAGGMYTMLVSNELEAEALGWFDDQIIL